MTHRKRLLVACEFSGVVRDAFTAHGWDAWSCDLLPTERPGQHIQGDVLRVLNDGWHMVIAHPPCKYLARSGARWWPDRHAEQYDAIQFVIHLWGCAAPMMALENPIGCLTRRWCKWSQIIQPWQFGHGETKATCLWLRNLPHLVSTCQVNGRYNRVHRCAPSPERWKERSRTLPGIAQAMATQWTSFANTNAL